MSAPWQRARLRPYRWSIVAVFGAAVYLDSNASRRFTLSRHRRRLSRTTNGMLRGRGGDRHSGRQRWTVSGWAGVGRHGNGRADDRFHRWLFRRWAANGLSHGLDICPPKPVALPLDARGLFRALMVWPWMGRSDRRGGRSAPRTNASRSVDENTKAHRRGGPSWLLCFDGMHAAGFDASACSSMWAGLNRPAGRCTARIRRDRRRPS